MRANPIRFGSSNAMRHKPSESAMGSRRHLTMRSEKKLMNFASAAHGHPAFASELPRFVSEVRRMFSAEEIRTQLARLECEQSERDAESGDPDEEEVFSESPAMAAERVRQFATIKELLIADMLGTS